MDFTIVYFFMRRVYLLSTFLLSLTVLLFEIAIIRLFSVVFFSNFAFIAISVALFGVAMGGLIVYWFEEKDKEDDFLQFLGKLGIAFGAAIILFIIIFLQLNFADSIFWLAAGIILAAFPFVLANIILTLLFKRFASQMGRMYFFDLLGAAMGVALALLLMTYLSAIEVIVIGGVLGVVAGSFLHYSISKKKYQWWLLVVVLLFLVIGNHYYLLLKMNYSKGVREAGILFEKWNSFSRITVEDPLKSLRSIADLGFSKILSLPQLHIRIDSGAVAPVIKFDGDWQKVEDIRYDVSTLAYQLRQSGEVLIIGVGGGIDVIRALMFDHQVVGVDINPIIINDLMKDKLKNFSGNLYFYPQVDIKVAEGRSFIAKSKEQFDIIALPLVDTWASTVAGNLALVESNLYTTEAFVDYLTHLSDDGILTISRWEFDGRRLVSLFLAASEKLGISNPEKNIVVVEDKQQGLNNFLFKKVPFSQSEIEQIEKFVEQSKLRFVYNPLKFVEDSSLSQGYYQFINPQTREEFIKSYPLNLRPVFDDSPFYFFLAPLSKVFSPYQNYAIGGSLGTAAIILSSLAIFIILFPFLFIGGQRIVRFPKLKIVSTVAYFASLGLAFIMVEIALIQKFILYLEKPIYSYSVILFSLLLFAGVGSIISQRFDSQKFHNYIGVVLSILLLIIIYVISLPLLIKSTLAWSVGMKVLTAALLVAPVALPMGMMLPWGFRWLSAEGMDDLLPWSWAVNGAMSVIATVLALVVAIGWGFSWVLLLGGMIYALAVLFMGVNFYWSFRQN